MEKDDIELLYDHYWTSKDTIHMAGHDAPGVGGSFCEDTDLLKTVIIFEFGS